MDLTRRDLLRSATATALFLSINRLGLALSANNAAAPGVATLPDYRTWEDLYRRA